MAVIIAVSVSVSLLSPSESVRVTLAPQGSPHKGLYSALRGAQFLKAVGWEGMCSTHHVEISLSNLIICGPAPPPILNIDSKFPTFLTSHSPISWLNDPARQNIEPIFVTFDVSQVFSVAVD